MNSIMFEDFSRAASSPVKEAKKFARAAGKSMPGKEFDGSIFDLDILWVIVPTGKFGAMGHWVLAAVQPKLCCVTLLDSLNWEKRPYFDEIMYVCHLFYFFVNYLI